MRPGEQPESLSVETGIQDVFELRFSPDGRFLVAIGTEQIGVVRMQDRNVSKLPTMVPNPIETQPELSFSANGQFLAVWTSNEIQLLNLEKAELVGQVSSVDEHMHVGSSSIGPQMIIAYASGRICLSDWSSRMLRVVIESRGPRILAADYSDMTRQLAVGTVNGTIDCLEIADVNPAP